MEDTKHDVIHTGGNVWNDYISDFDQSGRVIVVAESGIYVFANDRDYQLSLDPLMLASGPDQIDDYLPECEEHSYIADLQSTTDYVFIRDTSGATLTVYRERESNQPYCPDCHTPASFDDIGTVCRRCRRGVIE